MAGDTIFKRVTRQTGKGPASKFDDRIFPSTAHEGMDKPHSTNHRQWLNGRHPRKQITMKTYSARQLSLPDRAFLLTRTRPATIAHRVVPARSRPEPAPQIPVIPVDRNQSTLVFVALFIPVAVAIFLCVQTMRDFAASLDRAAASPGSEPAPIVAKK